MDDTVVTVSGQVWACCERWACAGRGGHGGLQPQGAHARLPAVTRGATGPRRSVLVEPGNEPRPCYTMNGNTTLVPRAVVRRVGNIDPAFVQQMRDFDYGLRARAAGCSVWVAPGTVGTCASHPERRPGERPFFTELRELWSIKTLPPGPWAVYARRWAGRLWPLYWASPYLRRGYRPAREHLLARLVAANPS